MVVHDQPRTLAVREDRLLPHVDAWLCELFAPERYAARVADAYEHAIERRRTSVAVW